MVGSTLNDVMSHFELVFLAYIILFVIVNLNFYKALYIKKNLAKDNNKFIGWGGFGVVHCFYPDKEIFYFDKR
ncbi:MAG: hypothetical protein RSA29_14615 [Clostridium sp.]|uniref:hypothetical protein n=1 Tax=Clostridium sp. TaxID=1506 RepID=UPI003216EBF2